MLNVRKEGDDMLADILLGMIILGGMAYGMYLMFRVDCWTAEERKLQEDEETREPLPQAVVFGRGSRRKQVEKWLNDRAVEAVYIEDVCIRDNWDNVQYVIALSESDADNLSICNLMRKMYGTAYLFSICNEGVNESVYHRFHIRILKEDGKIWEQLGALLAGKEVSIA
ncbi:hypothetical protein HMPREF0980_00192 [Dorea sp. D27]|nr:hypothetical protein HMPREF0980_00192 [Dorea sp. D27]